MGCRVMTFEELRALKAHANASPGDMAPRLPDAASDVWRVLTAESTGSDLPQQKQQQQKQKRGMMVAGGQSGRVLMADKDNDDDVVVDETPKRQRLTMGQGQFHPRIDDDDDDVNLVVLKRFLHSCTTAT